MTDYADFGSNRLVSASVAIPYYGLWVADISASLGANFPTQGTLTIGDLKLFGSVVRVGAFAATTSARLVGGFGGWLKPVGKRGYGNLGSLLLSLVLGDVALEVGEKVSVSNDGIVGSAYVREAGPAQRVLQQLAGSLWWVDSSGTTQVGKARSSAAIQSVFEVIDWHGGKGTLEVASETLSDWMPGRTFSSPTVSPTQTVGATLITSTNDGKLRLEVLVTP